ncbi:MAG: SAVED domain-containing protein, partial [Myxococcales bacterium]|nr:SAVED domain-containing protein [Myxococcales bacterium]
MVDAILIRHMPVRRFVVQPAKIDVLRPLWPEIEIVDIEPPARNDLHDFHAGYPWAEAAAQQERQIERIREARTRWPGAQLIYMGFVPIPLAFHLGTLLGQGTQIEIYNHQHDSHSWSWATSVPTRKLLAPHRAPAGDGNSTRELLHRVSVSYPVQPEQTEAIVREPQIYEVAVNSPSPTVLRSPADLWRVADVFKQDLDASHNDFPLAPMRHLVASVPVGLALAMGMQVNPTIHLPLQTWKYLRGHEHPYVPAICIGRRERVPRVLLLGASPLDEAISAPREVQEIHALLGDFEDRLRVVGRPVTTVEDFVGMLDEADPTVLHL